MIIAQDIDFTRDCFHASRIGDYGQVKRIPCGINRQARTRVIHAISGLEGVIRSAPMRKRSASQNSNYAQFVVPNADHFFDGEEKQLLEIVLNWLRNTVK